MPKEKLAKGFKRGVRSVKNSHTSPRALVLAKRRAEAYALRLQGYTTRDIAKQMHCHHSTAHDYVVRMSKEVPRETCDEARNIFMDSLEEMRASAHRLALKGDIKAMAECRKNIETQARLLGVLSPGGGLSVSINNNNERVNIGPDARQVGVRVVGIEPGWDERPDGSLWKDGKMIEPPRQPAPPLIEARPAEPVKFGPNVLKFDRC